jgi:hypothetical protein
MDLYRVWRGDNQHNCYWTRGDSEDDAIETISLTFAIQATELNAAPDGDVKHDVPYGIILASDGKTTTILRD